MTDDAVNTARFIEILIGIIDEVLFPAIALYATYLVRKWLRGDLEVPAYRHEVKLEQPVAPAAAAPERANA